MDLTYPAFVRYLRAEALLTVALDEFGSMVRFHRAVGEHLAGHDCDPEKLAEYTERAEEWLALLCHAVAGHRYNVEERQMVPIRRLVKTFPGAAEPAQLSPEGTS